MSTPRTLPAWCISLQDSGWQEQVGCSHSFCPASASGLRCDKRHVWCSPLPEPHLRSIPAGADTLRPDAQGVVQQLKRMGTQVLLLSGDTQPAVDGIAHQAGIAGGSAWGGMRPEQKAAFVRQLREQGKVRAGGCAAFLGGMLWSHGAAEQAEKLLVSDQSPSGACCFHPALLVGGGDSSGQGRATCTGGWTALLTLPLSCHAVQQAPPRSLSYTPCNPHFVLLEGGGHGR